MADAPVELLIPVAVLLGSIALLFVRDRRAARRRKSARAGEAVQFRGVLSLSEGRFRRGTVTLDRPHVQWSRRGSTTVGLSGAEVLAVSTGAPLRAARPDDLLVRLRLLDGWLCRLLLHEEDAAALVQALRVDGSTADGGSSLPPAVVPAETAERPTPPLWAVLCIAVTAVWFLGWLWLVVAGESRSATVTGGDGEGLCTVVWTGSDGRGHRSEVDCDDEPAGSPRDIWALGPPFDGEAVEPTWTFGSVLVLGLTVASPGIFRLVRGPRAHPGWQPTSFDIAPLPRLAPLDPADLAAKFELPSAFLTRLAPYAARQRTGLTWEDPRTPEGGQLRPSRREYGRALLTPVVLLALVAALSAPWPYRWYVLHTSTTTSALAVSTGEEAIHGPGPIPEDITVRFRTASGDDVRADVATTKGLPKGTEVTVVYSQDKPGWARRDDEGDGLDRGAALGAGAGLLVLGWALIRLRRVRVRARATAVALKEPGRPGLALLTADPDGDPVLLVTDPVVTPTVLTAVALKQPLPVGAAASFNVDVATQVRLYGRLTPGSAVAVKLEGQDTWLLPGWPAFQPESEDLAFLLDSPSALIEDDDEDKSEM